MIDARIYGIAKRIQNVRRVLSMVSGKGGVGKSTIASILSLVLKDAGYRVGLLDLDFHGPACHIILGIGKFQYHEEHGIRPHIHEGIEFASIYPFVQDNYVPLRGRDISNAITEFLSIINWGDLDFLVIDMPPGMSDPFLDILRYIPNTEHIVITTPSKLALQTVARLLLFLREQKYRIMGIIENMKTYESNIVRKLAEKVDTKLICEIPYDGNLEESIGNPASLRKTDIYKELKEKLPRIIGEE